MTLFTNSAGNLGGLDPASRPRSPPMMPCNFQTQNIIEFDPADNWPWELLYYTDPALEVGSRMTSSAPRTWFMLSIRRYDIIPFGGGFI